jgi:hypothetical protein
LPTTVRFSDEFQTHSRIGLLWTTFKRFTSLRGDSGSISPTNLAEEAEIKKDSTWEVHQEMVPGQNADLNDLSC